MYQWHGSGGGFMWIFWIVFIVALLWALATVIDRGKRANNRQSSALNILEQRYAKGEIEREEFEQKRKDLSD